MTIFDSTAYEVSKETFEYAQKVAVRAKDETSRKRIYEALICLYTLAEYFTSEGYTIDLENNLFGITPLNEELECNDLRGNGRCIDVRTVVNGKYVLIPKAYYKYNVLPDLFAVAKYNSDSKTVNILGCIEPLQVEKQRQNEKYYIMDTSQLTQPFQIEDRIKLVKNTKISDQNHDLYASYFIDYCDGVLSEENKKKLFNHLFECKGCRERFADYFNCELITKHSSEYPQILQDQMLNIVGATAVDNEKYKNYEEITLEIDKEPDKYADDEENNAEDPLQVLYGTKGLNTDVFNSFKQKSLLPKDKKPKSMLDSVLADIPKLPVNNNTDKKSVIAELSDNEENSADKTTVGTGKISPELYQEDYSDGIVYENESEDKDDLDYIEDIVTPEPDPAIYNKEEDEPLFLNELNPKTEQTSAVDEMLLLDAPVAPDISNFANFKKSDIDISSDDEDDVIIIDEEDEDNEKQPAPAPKLSVLDKALSSVQSSKALSDIPKDIKDDDKEDVTIITDDIKDDVSELDKYENVDENDLVHFDVEDIDIADEVGNQYVLDNDKKEQTDKVFLLDDENSETLEIEDDKEQNEILLTDEHLENNQENTEEVPQIPSANHSDIDFAEIKIDIGDDNPMFSDFPSEVISENSDSEIDLRPDENTTNIDDFLNSDLFNINDMGDIDLSLNSDDDKDKFEEPNTLELSTNDLYSDIGEVIPNMYDITETPDKEQEVIVNDDEDDEIILVDDHNRPIINHEETKNDDEDIVLISDNQEEIIKDDNDENAENKEDAEDEDIVIISDDEDYGNNSAMFVRPASVSDLNNKFIMEDSEDISKNDDIDALDDDVTFVEHDEEETDDGVSFPRPTGAMSSISQEESAEENSQNINVLFGNDEEAHTESNEARNLTSAENTVKFDEDGFEISDEDDDSAEDSDSQNYADSEQNPENTEEVSEDESEYETDEEEEFEETDEEEYEESDGDDEPSDNKKNTIKKAAIIALIALVGLGSVGGGLFFYMQKTKQEQMKNIAALNSLKEEPAPTENSEGNPDDGISLSDEAAQLPSVGENAENSEQLPPPTENAVTEPQKLPEPPSVAPQPNKAEQSKSKDMNQAMTNAFSANPGELKVTKTSWAVAPYIVADAGFKAFLQTSGRAIQAEIKKNLVSVRDNTYSENTKVQISINEGAVKEIVISKSSGSKQIDEIVLQSVKDYMANIQLPKLSETTVETIKKTNGNNSFKITLSVNF